MAAKKPPGPKGSSTPTGLVVRWRFDDGTDASMPFEECQRTLADQRAALFDALNQQNDSQKKLIQDLYLTLKDARSILDDMELRALAAEIKAIDLRLVSMKSILKANDAKRKVGNATRTKVEKAWQADIAAGRTARGRLKRVQLETGIKLQTVTDAAVYLGLHALRKRNHG